MALETKRGELAGHSGECPKGRMNEVEQTQSSEHIECRTVYMKELKLRL